MTADNGRTNGHLIRITIDIPVEASPPPYILEQIVGATRDHIAKPVSRVQGVTATPLVTCTIDPEDELLKHKDDRSYWASRCHAVILENRALVALIEQQRAHHQRGADNPIQHGRCGCDFCTVTLHPETRP